MKKKLLIVPLLALVLGVALSGCYETRPVYYERHPYRYHHRDHDRDWDHHRHYDRDDYYRRY